MFITAIKEPQPRLDPITLTAVSTAASPPSMFQRGQLDDRAHEAALVTCHSKDLRVSQSVEDNARPDCVAFVRTVAARVHKHTPLRFWCVL